VLLCFDLIVASVLAATYRQNVLALIMSIDVLIIFPLMYLGSSYGAEGMAFAKLAGTFITILYHIVVVVMVLKADLRSWKFLFSCVYSIMMMIITILVPDLFLKLSLILLLIGLFLVFRESPLRDMGRQVQYALKH